MRRELEDGTIRLREARRGDLPALERGLADPDVVRWLFDGRTVEDLVYEHVDSGRARSSSG